MSISEILPQARATADAPAGRKSRSLPLTILAMALFAAMAVLGVLLRPAMPIDETRYLTVAWEMRSYGNWIVPHLNGEIYAHKPPLLFWLINLVWAVTGPSDFAARLVGPAFGLGSIALTSRLAQALFPKREDLGGYAALALAGMAGFAFFAGLTMFDAMLCFATVMGVLALVHAARIPQTATTDPVAGTADTWADSWLPWAGYGAAIALGVISKGPVILIHLLPVALAMPLWAGLPLRRTAQGVAIGLGVAVLLVLLWLVPALLLGGAQYREEILWTQSAGRVVSSFAHQKPFWFFLPLLPILTWPWSWSRDFWRSLIRLGQGAGPELGLKPARSYGLLSQGPMAVWIVATVVIFSLISGKQIHYLVPMLPAVAILAAPALAQGARAPVSALLPFGVGLYLLALSLGFAGGDAATVLGPNWLLIVTALAMFAIAALAIWRQGAPLALMSPLMIVVLSLLFLGKAGTVYDAAIIGAQLGDHDAAGIATLDSGYAGEFGFAGRLADPVVRLSTPAEAEVWISEQPNRVVMGRMDEGHPQMPPHQTINFRGRDYGLWLSPSAPSIQPEVQ